MKISSVCAPHHFYWWKWLQVESFLASRTNYNQDGVSMQRGCGKGILSRTSLDLWTGLDLRYRMPFTLGAICCMNICNTSCPVLVLWTLESLSVLSLRSEPYFEAWAVFDILEIRAVFINILFFITTRPHPMPFPWKINTTNILYICLCFYVLYVDLWYIYISKFHQLWELWSPCLECIT